MAGSSSTIIRRTPVFEIGSAAASRMARNEGASSCLVTSDAGATWGALWPLDRCGMVMVMSLIIETLFATTLPDFIEVLLQALSFGRHAGAGTTRFSGAWTEKRWITVVTSAGESDHLNELAGGIRCARHIPTTGDGWWDDLRMPGVPWIINVLATANRDFGRSMAVYIKNTPLPVFWVSNSV